MPVIRICLSLFISVFLVTLFSKVPGTLAQELPALKFYQTEIVIAQAKNNQDGQKSGRSLMDFGTRNPDDQNASSASSSKKNATTTDISYWQSLTIWINQKQIVLSKTLSDYLQKFQQTNDYSFAVILIILSFLYGLVHAAGPGHGKVVVSSYIMANNQTLKRGIFLSFLSSFVQGTVAVSLVAIPAFIFSASGSTIKKLGLQFTQISYVLIILLGTYLLSTILYRKWQTVAETNNHNHSHGSGSHDHEHDEHCGCGHSHIPSAEQVQGKWDIAKIISLVLSVGLRPCTGALYVLALALIKGVFWVGALSVYAMALGTAITISLVTIAVVSGRSFAFFSVKQDSRFGSYLYDVCTIGGAIVIILFGSLLLSSSFTPVTPF